jgi:hypothetical protein
MKKAGKSIGSESREQMVSMVGIGVVYKTFGLSRAAWGVAGSWKDCCATRIPVSSRAIAGMDQSSIKRQLRSSSRRGPSLGVAKAMVPWEPRLAACIARHGMYEEAWDCLPVLREQTAKVRVN